MRNLSKVSEDWWDYTTLDEDIVSEAARLSAEDLKKLERPGFSIKFKIDLAVTDFPEPVSPTKPKISFSLT